MESTKHSYWVINVNRREFLEKLVKIYEKRENKENLCFPVNVYDANQEAYGPLAGVATVGQRVHRMILGDKTKEFWMCFYLVMAGLIAGA